MTEVKRKDSYLAELENKSIYIIREAYKQFKNPALLWSIGKDSTVLLWLCRKAFPFGKIPFPVIHIDTGYKFKEIYEFRDKYAKEWELDLAIAENKDAEEKPEGDHFKCCNTRKTDALKNILKEKKYDALLLGIRRDEHGIRGKERYFSPRDKEFHWKVVKEKLGGDSQLEALQDTEMSGWGLFNSDFGKDCDHVRVHPLLHWTELEVWNYIKQENIPTVSLYYSKEGKRYRSIGCEPCCTPIESKASNAEEVVEELKTTTTGERDGRKQDKERIMERLRAMGYM